MKNVFVIGLDERNRRFLKTIRDAGDYNIIPLLRAEDVDEAPSYEVDRLLDDARQQLDAFGAPIDAIATYVDIPASAMVPILCREYGLPGPSLEAVLKCQHKYWARLEQRRLVPEHIPRFQCLDPFDPAAPSRIDLTYPFWIKPIKSAGSFLAFRIRNKRELEEKLKLIRKRIRSVWGPFDDLMEHARLPPEVARVHGGFCIAEETISGRQCTLEGYSLHGRVEIFGAVDSIRHPNRTTFLRYQYPSLLPVNVVARMNAIARRAIEGIGLDDSAFNVEFYWDARTDRIWLLEINTRISQAHSYDFYQVDGASNHQVMVAVALGNQPEFPRGKGRHRFAAKCFLRKYDDAVVVRVPGPEQVQAVERRFPDSRIVITVKPGTRLSELVRPESYSYELAWIFVTGETPQMLLERYRSITGALDFQFAEVDVPGRRAAY